MGAASGELTRTQTFRRHIVEATGASGEYVLAKVPFTGNITAVRLVNNATVVANANSKTIAIRNRTTGAGANISATHTGTATGLTAFVAATPAISGTSTNNDAVAGDVLTIVTTLNGTGWVLDLLVEVDFARD